MSIVRRAPVAQLLLVHDPRANDNWRLSTSLMRLTSAEEIIESHACLALAAGVFYLAGSAMVVSQNTKACPGLALKISNQLFCIQHLHIMLSRACDGHLRIAKDKQQMVAFGGGCSRCGAQIRSLQAQPKLGREFPLLSGKPLNQYFTRVHNDGLASIMQCSLF